MFLLILDLFTFFVLLKGLFTIPLLLQVFVDALHPIYNYKDINRHGFISYITLDHRNSSCTKCGICTDVFQELGCN